MDQFGVFVYYLIFHIDIFSDYRVRKDHTVFNHSACFDHTASSDYRILYGSFDEASIGNNRILYAGAFKILGRTGIIGPGINGPVITEKALTVFSSLGLLSAYSPNIF